MRAHINREIGILVGGRSNQPDAEPHNPFEVSRGEARVELLGFDQTCSSSEQRLQGKRTRRGQTGKETVVAVLRIAGV